LYYFIRKAIFVALTGKQLRYLNVYILSHLARGGRFVLQKSIETERLEIRPFVMDDLTLIHHILDQTFGSRDKIDDQIALQERRSWLEWSILNQKWFPQQHQPPYGDRAIVLKSTRVLIGSIGYVPLLDVYEQIPELSTGQPSGDYTTTEFGLFWVIDPLHQRLGYATEAARAMISYAFKELRLKRIIATTEYTNTASQGVMQKVGMQITRNPLPDPFWLQIVGILESNGFEDLK
jgi:ribosomal-protein-alanine N-acetyltransferase